VPPAIDEDCSGVPDDVPKPCDDNIMLTDTDPMNGAAVIELCQKATPQDRKWGVLAAKYTALNGKCAAAPGFQVGVMDDFGPNVHVQGGKKMLAISSGSARLPGQQDACNQDSYCLGNYAYGATCPGPDPAGFPQNVPNCPAAPSINNQMA